MSYIARLIRSTIIATALLGSPFLPLSSQAKAQVGGTVAGSAISSARTFAAKANSVTCPDEATRQRLEREGQAIVGELQQLTQASIDHEQSSLTPQLISASTTVTDALNGLGRNCSPPKGAGGPIKYDTGYFFGDTPNPHATSGIYPSFLGLGGSVHPYVGFALTGASGKSKFDEAGSSSDNFYIPGGGGGFVLGAWVDGNSIVFNTAAAYRDWADYCEDNDDDPDCWLIPTGPGYLTGRIERAVVRTPYAPERKTRNPAMWRIKPVKPSDPFVGLRFGIENNLSFGNVSGSTTVNCAAGCRTSNTVLDTLVGKVGITFGRFLPYLAGGLAYGNIRTVAGAFPGNTVWNAGWAAGGGIEAKLTRRISAKLEYLYVDLGSGNCTPVTCGGNASIRLTENIVRFGINFELGSPSAPSRSPPLITK
jgi:hypothetical protein